jgi:hypothetical protein
METIAIKPLTPDERQANVDRIIGIWKKGREQDIKEAKEFINTSKYKEIVKELIKKNAERGIVIPEL